MIIADEPPLIDVLLVEDSPTDALLAHEALRESSRFHLTHVTRLNDALTVLSKGQTSVVLLDLGLPDSQGLATLDTLHRHFPDVPVVVLTARDDEELAVHSAQAGAHEYLVKIQLQEGNLRRAIRYVIERARFEGALRESEQQLRAIINTTPQCIKVVGTDGIVLEMNTAGLCMVEAKTPGAVIGQSYYPLIAPECRHDYLAFHEAVCRGHCGTLEYDIVGQQGTRRRLETVGAPLSNRDGSTSHLAITQDVTERWKAEAELRLRDRAIQAVDHGILVTDVGQPDNPIIYASPGFERLTGYSMQETIGRNCRFLQGEETDSEAVRQLREAVVDKRSCSVELLNYRKDGTPFWNAVAISPILDSAGRVTHFVGVQSDVTERRSLADQLRQSQKMDAIGRLAGGVAHDFNNMLAIILGYCEVLQDDNSLSDNSKNLTGEIHNAAKRAAALTAQLLAFSRQQVLMPQVVNLNDVIGESQKMLGRLIGEDVALHTSLFPEIWAVKVDVGQIEQVLLNLAVNGRDAMPRGGMLTIETANVELDDACGKTHPGVSPGAYAVIAVTDTGCGMSPKIVGRIFEPFFTTKAPDTGTGLGLATVFGIVNQSGGHVTVYSEPDHGTTFKVYLPKAEAPSMPSPEEQPQSAHSQGTEAILVVEDEEVVRRLACRILESKGYSVVEACNGKEALRAFERDEGTIALVLTDVVMPEMSGRALSEKLRLIRPDLKVLFMSGYTDDAVVRHGVLEAESHFIQKPFSQLALTRAVRGILDGPLGFPTPEVNPILDSIQLDPLPDLKNQYY